MKAYEAERNQRALMNEEELIAAGPRKFPRPEFASYRPTDTVGTLIGRAFVSFLPVANLWAAMFDLAPDVFERVFNQPLVPEDKP